MLGDVLKKEDCANCRFCCSFRRASLWELPRLSESFADTRKKGYDGRDIRYVFSENQKGRWAVTDLTDRYMTEDPEEEVACPFLDPERGCTLSPEEKPFDCSMWPLRYMRMPDGNCRVCLTPTCPAMNRADISVLKELTRTKWGPAIRDAAEKDPCMIMDYREGHIPLE